MKKPILRAAILGASRGLGRSLAYQLVRQTECEALFLSSRTLGALDELRKDLRKDREDLQRHGQSLEIQIEAIDFSQTNNVESLLKKLESFNLTHLFYVAGGGPHGPFWKKSWSSHLWTWQVNFLFPAEIVHRMISLRETSQRMASLEQVILIGSAIAESKPDPMAASYAAAKHALRGLVTSLKLENPPFLIDLFSPGYMDTSLLPPRAWPRTQGLVQGPSEVAREILLKSLHR